jgi:hypothetical protein
MYVCVCTVWFLSGGCGKKSDMKSGGSEAPISRSVGTGAMGGPGAIELLHPHPPGFPGGGGAFLG